MVIIRKDLTDNEKRLYRAGYKYGYYQAMQQVRNKPIDKQLAKQKESHEAEINLLYKEIRRLKGIINSSSNKTDDKWW